MYLSLLHNIFPADLMYTMYAWFETLCTFTTVLIACIVYMDICCGAT